MFNPIARYFWRPAAIDPTRFPWSHGPEAEANFRRLAELRYRLLPYYCCLAWEAHLAGIPLLRPMMLEFPGEARFTATEDQLMIGDCLLLAPVLHAGARERSVMLPDGVWHDFWSARSWAGGQRVSVQAPLDRVPLMACGGSILPLGPIASSIPDAHTFRELELHLWPPYRGTRVFREEDGRTRRYLHGQFASTRMEVRSTGTEIELRIDPADGTYPELPAARRWRVVLHRAIACGQARVDGRQVQPSPGGTGETMELPVSFRTQDGCVLEIPGIRGMDPDAV
jgi:alpha-glucosidase (family GH31 glycosyl hydrolase)